jgi:hypothetical protein
MCSRETELAEVVARHIAAGLFNPNRLTNCATTAQTRSRPRRSRSLQRTQPRRRENIGSRANTDTFLNILNQTILMERGQVRKRRREPELHLRESLNCKPEN